MNLQNPKHLKKFHDSIYSEVRQSVNKLCKNFNKDPLNNDIDTDELKLIELTIVKSGRHPNIYHDSEGSIIEAYMSGNISRFIILINMEMKNENINVTKKSLKERIVKAIVEPAFLSILYKRKSELIKNTLNA